MTDIIFTVQEGYEWMLQPEKASNFVPNWYKEMPQRINELDDSVTFPTGTAKICSPFSDALNAGYILSLPMQVFVRAEEDTKVVMTWNQPPGSPPWTLIDEHSHLQLPGIGMGLETAGVFKFNFPWAITIPEGYAALYTHPFNRPDLPFLAFSGIVDAGYMSPVNIPFIWTAGDQQVILDAGTPICQIIPFKLEEWDHSYAVAPDKEINASGRTAQTFVTGYRRMFRKQKVWR